MIWLEFSEFATLILDWCRQAVYCVHRLTATLIIAFSEKGQLNPVEMRNRMVVEWTTRLRCVIALWASEIRNWTWTVTSDSFRHFTPCLLNCYPFEGEIDGTSLHFEWSRLPCSRSNMLAGLQSRGPGSITVYLIGASLSAKRRFVEIEDDHSSASGKSAGWEISRERTDAGQGSRGY
jgi:hypothetical protein